MKFAKGLVCGTAVLALALSAQAALIGGNGELSEDVELIATGSEFKEGTPFFPEYPNPNTAAEIQAISGVSDLALLVKGGEGLFASSYDTVFGSENETVSISYNYTGPRISGTVYLLVKDGLGAENQVPYWYLYQISDWDGYLIEVGQLWPDQGGISYAGIWGSSNGFVPPDGTGVPDGGSTMILLGAGMVGLVSLRRRLA